MEKSKISRLSSHSRFLEKLALKRFTSSIILPFLVFQNLIMNFGPFKRTFSIPSHWLIFFYTADKVAVCVVG